MTNDVSNADKMFAGDFEYYDDAAVTPAALPIAIQLKAGGSRSTISVDESQCIIWSGNTRDLAALKGSASFRDLKDSIAALGQQVPAIARISRTDQTQLEIIAGASRLTALRSLNDERPDQPVRFLVEVREVSDAEAYRLVDAENTGRAPFAPIEKARFYERAIEGHYGTDAALAEALGIHKSTIGRTRDILRLPDELMALIRDKSQISAAQADSFLKDWSEPNLQPTLARAIGEFGEAPAAAASVFRTMKAAVASPSVRSDDVVRLKNGQDIGKARRVKPGKFVIEVNTTVSDGNYPNVGFAIAEAIHRLSN